MKYVELIGLGLSFLLTAVFANTAYLGLVLIFAVMYSLNKWQEYEESKREHFELFKSLEVIDNLQADITTLKNDQSRTNDQIMVLSRNQKGVRQ